MSHVEAIQLLFWAAVLGIPGLPMFGISCYRIFSLNRETLFEVTGLWLGFVLSAAAIMLAAFPVVYYVNDMIAAMVNS